MKKKGELMISLFCIKKSGNGAMEIDEKPSPETGRLSLPK